VLPWLRHERSLREGGDWGGALLPPPVIGRPSRPWRPRRRCPAHTS
jgi:hypothetical protein